MVAKFYTSEECGKKPMGFNMFQPSKGGAGFRKNPQFISESKQWLSGFSTQQWLLYVILIALTGSVFWDYSPYSFALTGLPDPLPGTPKYNGNPRGTPKMVKQQMMVKMVKQISIVS